VHERALLQDVLRKIEEVTASSGATRVTHVGVRLGALSHFTPEHFREHFADASRGTTAEGARVDAVLDDDIEAPDAQGVVIESIEVELPERVRS
jgi:hydrogenase nickel incorporation protein HypA/HybF